MHRVEAYITLALILIGGLTVLYLPVLFCLRKRGIGVLRQISYWGLGCSLFLIMFATILFVPITFRPETYILNLKPFAWLGRGNAVHQLMAEKLPNILLFVPLGFFLPAVWKRAGSFWGTMTISFVITFGVEFFQYFIGRSSDIDDLITNLLGAVMGYFLFRLSARLLGKQKLWGAFTGRNN